MKNIKSKVSDLLEQIKQIDLLIALHKTDSDDFMIKQYLARKNDFLKELVYELLKPNETTAGILLIVKDIIQKLEKDAGFIEEQVYSKKMQFSIRELEAIIAE